MRICSRRLYFGHLFALFFLISLTLTGPSLAQQRTTGSPLLDSIINLLIKENVYDNNTYAVSQAAGFAFCVVWNKDAARCKHRSLLPGIDKAISFEEGVCAAGVGDVNADACDVLSFGIPMRYSLGDAVCRALTGGDVVGVCRTFGEHLPLAQGICRGATGARWSIICGRPFGISLGEAICLAGLKDSNWASICLKPYGEVMTIDEAIDALPILNTETVDVDWDWDGFDNQGNYVWVCRGVQTGQFAEYAHCDGDLKVDDRWPG